MSANAYAPHKIQAAPCLCMRPRSEAAGCGPVHSRCDTYLTPQIWDSCVSGLRAGLKYQRSAFDSLGFYAALAEWLMHWSSKPDTGVQFPHAAPNFDAERAGYAVDRKPIPNRFNSDGVIQICVGVARGEASGL